MNNPYTCPLCRMNVNRHKCVTVKNGSEESRFHVMCFTITRSMNDILGRLAALEAKVNPAPALVPDPTPLTPAEVSAGAEPIQMPLAAAEATS